MGYNIQVADGGYLGWKLLERTIDTQRETFAKGAEVQRARDYFIENISSIESAEDLVDNYKLLSVALRAFGLDEDINNKYFIRKVLEADPDDDASLINKLPDKRYEQLNAAFQFWNSSPTDTETSRIDINSISDMYITRSLERNVGERHQEIEVALNAKRELAILANADISDNAKWYQILGSKPLREVFQGAFGLDQNFARLPLERQLSELKKRTDALTGDSGISQFKNGGSLDKLLKHYLIRSQLVGQPDMSPYSTALAIISSQRPG